MLTRVKGVGRLILKMPYCQIVNFYAPLFKNYFIIFCFQKVLFNE